MSKKNKTILIVAGVAAAAAIAYFITRPKTVTTVAVPVAPAAGPASGSLLTSGSSLLSSLMGAGGATWLTNLFKGENSPASTYTAGGPADIPSTPSNNYLDITGNENGTNFLV